MCKAHKDCDKCKKCIASWKQKANTHAYKATALKFVLMSLLDDESVEYRYDDDTSTIPEMPEITTEGKQIKYSCSICTEKMTMGGKRDMCAMGCGHTICYSCANNEYFRKSGCCPFCRKEVNKIIKLYYEEEPTEDAE
jgi:hypothetical protein